MTPQQQASQTFLNNAPSGNSQPNFLEQILPTAGAIGGGILGSLTDEFTGPLGTIGGASAGSALGQQLENSLTGGNQSTALAAGEGAIGQGVGMGVGNILGKIGGELISKAAQTGATQGIADEFPAAALNTATKTKLNFGDSVDLANQAGQPVTAQGFVNMANAGTGNNGLLNNVLDSQIKAQGPVDLSNFMNDVESAIGKASELPDSVAAKTTGQLRNMLQNTGLGGLGSLDETSVDPEGALALLRKVGPQISRYAGSEPGTTGAALEDIYRSAYKSLSDSIYNRPGVDEAISAIQEVTPQRLLRTPAGNVTRLIDAVGGDQKLAQFYSDALNNATTGKDITSLESKLMDMGNAGQKALDYQKNVGNFATPTQTAGKGGILSQLGGLFGPRGAELGGMAEATLGHNPILGGAMALGGAAAAHPEATGAALQGIAGSGAVTPLAQLGAHLPSVSPGNNSNNVSSGGSDMGPFQTTGNVDPRALTYALMFDPQLVPSMRAAMAAQSPLNALEQQYGAAGGGQGAGGILNALSGLFPGTAANNYNKDKLQAAAAISQATGAPLQTVLASLPSIMSNTQGAQTSFGGLQGSLGSLQGLNGASLLSGVQ